MKFTLDRCIPGCRESRGAMVLNGDEEVLRLHVVFLVL